MWRLLWLANLLVFSRSELTCEKALEICTTENLECLHMLMKVFSPECSSALGYSRKDKLITGAMQKTCPKTCVMAIQNLTSSRWGKYIESCVCARGDGICMTLKARMKRCVRMNEENFTIDSCTAATNRCSHDKYCKRKQNSFLRRCSQLISGLNCTQDCKRAQEELLRFDLGKALNDCECDGRNEHYCRAIYAYYEELCKGTRIIRNEPTPREKTDVKERRSNTANVLFELPEWILCAAIIAHIYVLFNR